MTTDTSANYKNGAKKIFRYVRLWTRPNAGSIAVMLHILHDWKNVNRNYQNGGTGGIRNENVPGM